MSAAAAACHECDGKGVTELFWISKSLHSFLGMLIISRSLKKAPCMYCKQTDFEAFAKAHKSHYGT